MSFVESVYVLSLVTCVTCASLLLRTYIRTRARLLLWSALCFSLLSLNNFFVVFDVILFPQIDFVPLRYLSALAGVSVLLIGFVWEYE